MIKVEVHGGYEVLNPVLYHMRSKSLHERLGSGVEEAEHGIDLPTSHQVDGVRVDPGN